MGGICWCGVAWDWFKFQQLCDDGCLCALLGSRLRCRENGLHIGFSELEPFNKGRSPDVVGGNCVSVRVEVRVICCRLCDVGTLCPVVMWCCVNFVSDYRFALCSDNQAVNDSFYVWGTIKESREDSKFLLHYIVREVSVAHAVFCAAIGKYNSIGKIRMMYAFLQECAEWASDFCNLVKGEVRELEWICKAGVDAGAQYRVDQRCGGVFAVHD